MAPINVTGGPGRARRADLTVVPDSSTSEPTSSERLGQQTLEALHDLYAGPLYAFALRLSGDPQRAEEAVQDALLRAWQHPDAVDGSSGSARAWLYTVVRNRVSDSWRHDAARPPSAGPAGLESVGVSDHVERAVEAWGVADAMSRLSESHRQVVHCSFYLGLSVDETALALRIPAGTVKSRTYYALRALRAAFEEMGYVR